VAHYHGCLEWDGGLADLLSEVERFSLDEYAPALLRGGRLSQDEREALAEKIAGYTGLSADFVLRCNNRVALGRFAAELLRHKRRQVGRLDARFVGMGTDAAKETLELDPSLHHIVGPFAAAFHHHLRHELGVEHDETYEFLNMDVHPWTFDGCENRYLDVGERLLRAMNCNPHLTIFVGSGLYDLATPYFAADHTVARIGQEPEVFGRFVVETYEAGHMMYLHEPSLAKLRGDLVRFYDAGSV
jgi:carboxypeptidase C (cathepsin A)